MDETVDNVTVGAGQRALREARRRNERWISVFLAGFAGIFFLWSLFLVASGEEGFGVRVDLAMGGAYGAYYLAVWLQSSTRPPTRREAIFRTIAECSVATLMVMLDAQADPTLAIQRVSVMIWCIAIVVSVLRLRAELALVAGATCALQWLGVWAWLRPQLDGFVMQATPVSAVNRAILLMLCGVLAHQIARTQSRLTVSLLTTVREADRVRRAFGVYVAEPVVRRILDGELVVRTERRPVTIMFVDIRGFTRFSEGRDPEGVLDSLNVALERFSLIVQSHDGIVNKYLGDGLMAIFGAPVPRDDHALEAARAALGIAAAADELREAGMFHDLHIGVGLNTGEVVVGDVGGTGHREYTAIGDVVNVASRVEALTKDLGADVVATAAVKAAVGDAMQWRSLGDVPLRGRGASVQLFALHAAS